MAVAAQYQPPALLTVARSDQILARAALTADQAAGLKPGGRMQVTAGGKSLTGTIMAIRARADNHYLLDVAIPRGNLLAGQSGTLHLP